MLELNGTRFGMVLSAVKGPPCFGVTLGWDTPTRLWRPYFTVEVLGRMICVGWTHLHRELVPENQEPATYERQGVATAMRRDYWQVLPLGAHALIAAAKVHDCDADEPRPFLFPNLLEEAGIVDGDEFEMFVTATDRRPHGGRRYLRDKLGCMRPETDEEVLERIDAPIQPATD